MNKVFISGSISIKKLPLEVINSIEIMIEKNMTILVGDALGVDSLVQDIFNKKNYFNVIIYSITSTPRYKANIKFQEKKIQVNQDIKSQRKRQTYKDEAMTKDSTFSLVIWDGKSKGSYANIKRALELKKGVKVYYTKTESYLKKEKILEDEIDYIYRENNGYTASEVIEYLQNNGIEKYNRSQDLNSFLIKENLLKKEGKIYTPTDKNSQLFIIEEYRGKPKGVKFSNQFIDWIEKCSMKKLHQSSLF